MEVKEVDCTLLEKKCSKRVLQVSPQENPFWFQVEPFVVPCKIFCGKGGTKKGSSKGSPMGTAKGPFQVQDSTILFPDRTLLGSMQNPFHKMCTQGNIVVRNSTSRELQEHACSIRQPEAYTLTFCLGAYEAGGGVAERAEDGPNSQTQVLVAGVETDRGEAEVWEFGRLLRAHLHMRDLRQQAT